MLRKIGKLYTIFLFVSKLHGWLPLSKRSFIILTGRKRIPDFHPKGGMEYGCGEPLVKGEFLKESAISGDS